MKGALALIIRRSLRRHALATTVTALSVALGVGLVTSLVSIRGQAISAFTRAPEGFDAVVGARGSQLQLVLSALFHLDTSPGNIPWSLYQQLADDGRIARAVPLAMGDSVRGFPVLGTTLELFGDEGTPGQLRPRAPGRVFDPERREAVIGATVATRTGLRRGHHFRPTHGVVEDAGHEHEDDYVVVGILERSGTPADRVIWIPLEGIFRMSDHVLQGAGEEFIAHPEEEIPDEHKELSAVLLAFHGPQTGITLDYSINRRGREATLAWPIDKVLVDLFDRLEWIHQLLAAMAALVAVVAAASILASLTNALAERRRELAILRALGARRRTLLAAIVGEATVIAALGSVAGLVVHAAIVLAVAAILRQQTGVVLQPLAWHPILIVAPVAMTILGAGAGLIPGWRAYATDVATGLTPAR